MNMTVDWEEFVVNGLCGLCGNAGVVDKRGQRSPAGYPCGALHYCVCPNGRKLKEQSAPKEEWLARNLGPVRQTGGGKSALRAALAEARRQTATSPQYGRFAVTFGQRALSVEETLLFALAEHLAG